MTRFLIWYGRGPVPKLELETVSGSDWASAQSANARVVSAIDERVIALVNRRLSEMNSNKVDTPGKKTQVTTVATSTRRTGGTGASFFLKERRVFIPPSN